MTAIKYFSFSIERASPHSGGKTLFRAGKAAFRAGQDGRCLMVCVVFSPSLRNFISDKLSHVDGIFPSVFHTLIFLKNCFLKIQFYVPSKIISAHMRRANQ